MRRIAVGFVLVAGTLLAACQTPSASTTTGAGPAPSIIQTNQAATSAPLTSQSSTSTGDTPRPLFIGVV